MRESESRYAAFVSNTVTAMLLLMATVLVAAFIYVFVEGRAARKKPASEPTAVQAAEPQARRDVASVCEETAAGIEFFLALEKRPSASWTRWVVIDGHCYVSNWDEVWTCDEAEKILAELQAKHLGAK